MDILGFEAYTVDPPSTLNTSPVMWSEIDKKTTASAISSIVCGTHL